MKLKQIVINITKNYWIKLAKIIVRLQGMMEVPSKIFWKDLKVDKEWMIQRLIMINNKNSNYFNKNINRLMKNLKILKIMINSKAKVDIFLMKNKK